MCIALAAPAVQAQEIADNYLNPPATDAEGHANPFVDSEEAALFDEAITLDEETSDTLISPMKTKVGVSPYGCHGRTHLVHKSGGMSSVHSGIIECKRPISTMVNGAEIMKKGWLGMWHRSALSSKTVRNPKWTRTRKQSAGTPRCKPTEATVITELHTVEKLHSTHFKCQRITFRL